MSRPSYALTCLLLVFSGSLLLVGKARGEQLLNGSLGGVRAGMCPLLAEELGDGGLGLHFGSGCFGAPPHADRVIIPLRRTTVMAPPCAVNEWYGPCDLSWHQATKRSHATKVSTDSADWALYASHHDPVYDRAVYGIEQPAIAKTAPAVASQTTAANLGEGWDGWDWCEDACLEMQQQIPTKTAPVSGLELAAEPRSLDHYYAMYGGRLQAPRGAYQGCWTEASPAQPYRPTSTVVEIVRDWAAEMSQGLPVDHLVCRLESLRLTWKYRVIDGWYAVREQWVALQWRSYELADKITAPRPQPIPLAATVRRVTLVSAARSLGHVGQVLQNASRHLTQLVENDSLEISTGRGNGVAH